MERITTMRHFIVLCAAVVLSLTVFALLYFKLSFGDQRTVPRKIPYRQNFRKSWKHAGLKEIGNRKGTFAKENTDAIDGDSLHLTTNKLYSYDIAIVSMTPYWYSRSTLPREIICNNTNTSILVRKVTEDEDIRLADILIFAARVYNWIELQRSRHSEQLWVHTTEESPFTSLAICPPMEMNIRFNVSFTYHPKADISVPYGQFFPSRNKQIGDIYSNFNKKTKLIVWVSSHCVTKMWRRLDFAYDLAMYLPMDIYGACGTLECAKDHQRECKKRFSSYKFYLAMENSCCGGYITEKFWDALTYFEAIPVVVGAPRIDYEKLAPNNSFIHADDFSSMKELANYILKVSNRKALYDSYFEWKRLGKALKYPCKTTMAFSDPGVCRLTEYLKSSNAASLAVQSFDPYGPNWIGGCNDCGEQEWLKNYSNFKEMLKIKKQRQNARILKWSMKL